jgi:hypothetical protein
MDQRHAGHHTNPIGKMRPASFFKASHQRTINKPKKLGVTSMRRYCAGQSDRQR